MKRTVSLKLLTSPEQSEALFSLAEAYSRACNAMTPTVQAHRCWNRVALHHLTYYSIREAFPLLGSQMVCQAIHRVADAYKTMKANGDGGASFARHPVGVKGGTQSEPRERAVPPHTYQTWWRSFAQAPRGGV